MKLLTFGDGVATSFTFWRFAIIHKDAYYVQGIKRIYGRLGWIRRDVERAQRIRK